MRALFILLLTLLASFARAKQFDVTSFGAKADGQTLDTAAIQAAIDACAAVTNSSVRFPAGRYLSGTIQLRSGITIQLDAGARLVGTTNLTNYIQPHVPENLPESRWGKWHRALIVAENVNDVTIAGPGVIDGAKVFDPTGEERMRGPHAINFVNCRRITFRDLTITDAANYAVFFQVSDDIEVNNVKVIGGWDGIHWRGAPDRWCNNVKILNSQFYTGDDAIAGRYWTNTVIQNCLLNSTCNGVRLIGPATRLTIANNYFRGPGEQPHRASRDSRPHMLSGIILQPGAWDRTTGPLDETLLANNTMENVASPVTIWTKPGNTVGRVTISGLHATGVYRSALSVESWSDAPITNIILRDLHIDFTGGGKAWTNTTMRGPSVDVRPLPSWGLYLRNVQNLTLQDSRFTLQNEDARPAIFADKVEQLTLDNFKFSGDTNSIQLTNVTRLIQK